MTDLPQFLLTGDRLALTQLTRDHLETYHRWENDPDTIHAYGNHFPQAWEVRVAGWDRQRANERYRQFEVVLADTGAPVGRTTLAVNPYVNTAEYIVLIGPEHRRQGYAAEATRLTLEWAFTRAALRAVWLKVLTPNTSAIRAYTEAGFQEAGRLRAAGYWNGEPVDELLMDALADDHRRNRAPSGVNRTAPSSSLSP